jgi:transcriptional regulator with XRE-family HTH domain
MPKVDTYDAPWFASALRELREARRWSVEDLAHAVAAHTGGRARVSSEYVRKLERGDRVPSLQALDALLGTFGMTQHELEARFALGFGGQARDRAGQPLPPPSMAAPASWSADVGVPPATPRARRLPGLRSSLREAPAAAPPPYAAGATWQPPAPAAAAPAPQASATEADAARQAAELMTSFARMTPSQRAALVAQAARVAAGDG